MKGSFTAYLPYLLLTAVTACALGLLLSVAIKANASAPTDVTPGSAADPLVTQEWFEDYVQKSFDPLYKRLEQLELPLTGGVRIVLNIGSAQALVNGKAVNIPAPPQIMGAGYTMVPARFIGEALGLAVEWDAASRQVSFSGQGQSIVLTIDRSSAVINGQPYTMPMAPLIVSGYTLVHVRFVSEAFHCQVEWNAGARQVIVTK